MYQLTFTFNNEAKDEEEEPTTETTLTPVGTIVSPININPQLTVAGIRLSGVCH